MVLLPHRLGVADGDGGLDDHRRVLINGQHQLDHLLHVFGVKEILRQVVVRRRGDNDVSLLSRNRQTQIDKSP